MMPQVLAAFGSLHVAKLVLVVGLVLALPDSVRGSSVRGSDASGRVVAQQRGDELKAIVMEELMGAVSGDPRLEAKLLSLEQALRPMFATLPKNEHGYLGHSTARYALHRLFVQRHGIYMKGLEPGSDSWENASASSVFEDRVPSFVQAVFEERLSGRGLGLHELAILASTLEHMMRDEMLQRLGEVYEAFGLAKEVPLGKELTEDVIDVYMLSMLKDRRSTPKSIRQNLRRIRREYPNWAAINNFVEGVKQEVSTTLSQDSGFADGKLAFNATVRILEEVTDRLGRFQNEECVDLKSALLGLEHQGSGTVRLKDFYNGLPAGSTWRFTERIDYLRDLGALEEDDVGGQRVIIPNYVQARSNCNDVSPLYSSCCMNECEPLMAQLEAELATPEAEPADILRLVSAMPSSTVAAPRELTPELKARLEDIAGHHGGHVPLHGRLFGQWLHFAFPRECPYPQLSGTVRPATSSEQQDQHAQQLSPVLSAWELRELLEDLEDREEPAATGARQWSTQEELVAQHQGRRPRGSSQLSQLLLGLGFLGMLAAGSRVLWPQLLQLLAAAAELGLLGSSKQQGREWLPLATRKEHWC